MLDQRMFPALRPDTRVSIEAGVISLINEYFKGKSLSLDFGFVTHVHDDYTLDIDLNDDIHLKRVPLISSMVGERSGFMMRPRPGDQVVVGFILGDKSTPIALGFLYNEIDEPYSAKNGEFVFKHQTGTELKIDENGNFTLTHKSGAYISIDDSGNIKIYGTSVDINGTVF